MKNINEIRIIKICMTNTHHIKESMPFEKICTDQPDVKYN